MAEDTLNIGTFDGNPLVIEPEKLLTGRTAVIGMSGSGKSHLIGVLCEELCTIDLAFVVIDPEGEYNSLKEDFEEALAAIRPASAPEAIDRFERWDRGAGDGPRSGALYDLD